MVSMNLTDAPLSFCRALAAKAKMRLALIAMAASLCACEKSAATPQSASAPAPTPATTPTSTPAPTPATAEVLGLGFPAFLTTAPIVTQGKVSFDTGFDDDSRKYRVILNPGAQVIMEIPDYSLLIEEQHDFNGDGVVDALVSVHGGGNCCPPVYAFLTVYKGKAFVSALEEGWGEHSVSGMHGYPVVARKHVEATDYWRLKGTTAIKVGSKPKLKAFAEIRGVGAGYMGPEDEKITLRVDIDGDGMRDSITCGIWMRWGSLSNCELPLPGRGSQTLHLSCDRLGALKTLRNGLHELVCDNDTVIYFDGRRWRAHGE